jgi:hypothetical protein
LIKKAKEAYNRMTPAKQAIIKKEIANLKKKAVSKAAASKQVFNSKKALMFIFAKKSSKKSHTKKAIKKSVSKKVHALKSKLKTVASPAKEDNILTKKFNQIVDRIKEYYAENSQNCTNQVESWKKKWAGITQKFSEKKAGAVTEATKFIGELMGDMKKVQVKVDESRTGILKMISEQGKNVVESLKTVEKDLILLGTDVRSKFDHHLKEWEQVKTRIAKAIKAQADKSEFETLKSEAYKRFDDLYQLAKDSIQAKVTSMESQFKNASAEVQARCKESYKKMQEYSEQLKLGALEKYDSLVDTMHDFQAQ